MRFRNGGWRTQSLEQERTPKLGEILCIDYGWAGIRFSERIMRYDAVAEPSPPMPNIEPDEIAVGDNVTVVWAIG